MFSTLPPEIIAKALCFLDIPSLAQFRLTSSQSNELVLAFSETLFQCLSFNHGYLTPCSASASRSVISPQDLKSREHYQSDELNKAIKNQNIFNHSGTTIKTWREFARRRWLTDHNWLDCNYEASFIKVPDSIWRMKLDPEMNRLLFTLQPGGVRGYSLQGETTYSFEEDASYPHIEVSESYYVMNREDGYEVYRHSSITHPKSPPIYSNLPAGSGNLSKEYKLHAVLHPPGNCNASKARFPYFVAVARHAEKIFLFDFVQGKLIKSIDTGTIRNLKYVEIDENYIYLAVDAKVLSFSIADGRLETNPSLGWPRGTTNSVDEDFIEDMNFIRITLDAMHYDSYGNYVLVFTTESSSILEWSFKDSNQTVHSLLFLVEGTITQLAVENGRVIYLTMNDSSVFSLWYIDLKSNRDLASDFNKLRRNVPEAQLLFSPVPHVDIDGGIARIEMTNDQIFIPCYAPFTEEDDIIELLKVQAYSLEPDSSVGLLEMDDSDKFIVSTPCLEIDSEFYEEGVEEDLWQEHVLAYREENEMLTTGIFVLTFY